MIEIKTEEWNGNEIRFIYLSEEWYAVAVDVCKALGLNQVTRALTGLAGVTKSKVSSGGEMREVNIIPEKDIYRLAFKSRKPEAVAFQDWVLDTISLLRKSMGLEGFEVFKMMDKEHQKYCHSILSQANAGKIDYIKSNQIANKAISTYYGFDKSLKKDEMSVDMIKNREVAMEEVAKLMSLKLSGYDVDVKDMVYSKWS